MKVKVKNVRDGFYGFYGEKRRYVGDVFEINPEHFSNKWMEKIQGKPGPKPKGEGAE